MKSLVPGLLLAAAGGWIVSLSPRKDEIPPGALEQIRAALPAEAIAKPAKPRKLLVYSRTNGFRHASIPTGRRLLFELGEKTGAFEITTSEDPAVLEAESLEKFDAVCFLNTTGNAFAPPEAEWQVMDAAARAKAAEEESRRKVALMDFVRSGKGFVGIHAATDTCFEWPEYGEMINGWFDGHPWSADTKVSVKVEPGRENHPLSVMFEGANLDFTEEIYQLRKPYDSKAVTMLLRLDAEKTDMSVGGIKRTDGDFGISWSRSWGKGRVFYTSLGHNHAIYWHPKIVRHYLAGIQWALGDLEAGD